MTLMVTLLVHALHEKAKNFYLKYGFQPSPTEHLTLMFRLSVWVNGNWRLTFAFEGKHDVIVDYQDYH